MAQFKIINILWKANSPYGTYSSGDYVDVYYDDSTNDLVVKKNDVTITSGNQIPININHNGRNDNYYKTEKAFQLSVCDDSDLLKFERITSFPYIYKIVLQNHPTCSVTGEVCDLAFDTLPTVTGTSTATSLDGTITVSASGSNGAVQYKLNADFVFDDNSAQVSGTFSGLGKGNYLVYARDAANCLSVISVTVPLAKTYGVKYQLEYYDDRLGYHHKTEVLEKDYSGAITEVCGTDVPTQYNLRGEGEKNKFVSILTGELLFNVISETNGEFEDLYTNDPEKYRLRHSIDDGGGYDIMFTGKLLPNQYQERYISAPYEISLVATDGTALLADIPFLDDQGNRLTGSYKQIVLIAWLLKKIGLDLNIRSACNIYAVGDVAMNTTAADDPLDQAYVDVYRYYLIAERPSCLDVLKYLLEPYGAQLIQYYNVWNIIRVEERRTSFDYREYDDEGVYVSNGTYNPVKDIVQSTSSGLWWANQDQTLRINPGYGQIRLINDMGKRPNIFPNGDFTVRNYSVFQAITNYATGDISQPTVISGFIPDLSGFQIVNNGVIFTTGIEKLSGDNVAFLFSTNAVGAYIMTDIITLKLGNSEDIRLKFKFKIKASSNTEAHYVKVRINVTYGDYFLQDNGAWTTAESNIIYYVSSDQLNKFQDLEVLAASPDPTYAVSGESFRVKFYAAHEDDYTFTTFALLRVLPTVDLPEGTKTECANGDYLEYYELMEETGRESNPDIIRPDDYHSNTNPYQWVRVARKSLPSAGASTLFYSTVIDYISLEVLTNGNELPTFSVETKNMENENNLVLERIIYHGSLQTNGSTSYAYDYDNSPTGYFYNVYGEYVPYYIRDYSKIVQFIYYTAESADIAYCGYLRDSTGAGYLLWSRDALPQAKTLQQIYVDMYAAQYNRPWRQIFGSFIGDVLFTPIDVIRETMDNNRIYYAPSLSIDYRRNYYNAEFLELDAPTASMAFTTGFTIGFES